jgi:hydroxyacyl-ACP dehydratase HTD2-like protein with hotdog domain
LPEAIDIALLQQWVGRQEVSEDVATLFPVRALQATLEVPPYVGEIVAGDALPPLWHWLYFLPLHPRSALGADGHARKGGFAPGSVAARMCRRPLRIQRPAADRQPHAQAVNHHRGQGQGAVADRSFS